VDDVPLLDSADALLNGVRATYEHIVVDEAQDLSPLQLESIRRRSRTGSMTVLGDLAQATSPWAHESWDDVVNVLRHERVTAETVELEYGYRLPAEVHEVAMRLLPQAAPGLGSPRAVRSSGHEVAVADVGEGGDVVARVVRTVSELMASGIVGVITPASVRSALIGALDSGGIAWTPELRPAAAPVVVLAPDDAKGLEFDSVVVVEPAAIVDESEHGLRALYVALTRCTSRLALVHARPLPAVLGLGPPAAPPPPETAVTAETAEPVETAETAEPEVGTVVDETSEPEHAAEPEPRPEPEEVEAVVEVAEGWDEGGVDEGVEAGEVAEVEVAEVEVAEVEVAEVEAAEIEVADVEPAEVEAAEVEAEPEAGPEPVPAASGLAETVVVSTPAPDLAVALDALGDLDRDIARAVAAAVADKLGQAVSPALLPLVAAELVRMLQADGSRVPDHDSP
jgi:hypothetical protein